MKILLSDLDETLLSKDKKISKKNRNAILEWQHKGNKFIIASGRSYSNIQNLLKEYDIKADIIALNGAIIADEDGNIINQHSIDMKLLSSVINYCEEHQLIYLFYKKNSAYSRKFDNMMHTLFQLSKCKHENIKLIINSMQKYYQAFYENIKSINHEQIEGIIKSGGILKLEIFSYDPLRLEEIKKLLPDNFECASSSARNIEITEKGVNKGSALKTISQYYNVEIKNSIAIGDHSNDYEMLLAAGTSIAMNNALPEIKKIADMITKTNEEDGVSHAISKLLLSLNL